MGITYTGERGYISAQAKVGAGIIDSIFAGENAIHEPDGWRVFNGWKQFDPARTAPTLAYTATLTNGSNIAALSVGATAKTDFRFAQHVLIGRRLYVIEAIPSDLQLQISPTPDANEAGSGLAVKKVPALSPLNLDRATLLAGNAVRFREQTIFAVSDGDLFLNGSAISATLAATQNLKVAYPLSTGGFTVTNAGFTKPSAPTVSETTGGSKGLPTGAYWVAVARKRAGFSGQGNPSDRVPVTITAVNNRIRVALGAFDSSQGQTTWVILVNRIEERLKERPGLWKYIETTTQSANFDFDFFDEDLTERASYDNDAPPKALFVFTLGNHLAVASVGGPPDGSNVETTPGAEVAAGKYNNPEAFSPFARTPTQGGEVIAGVHAGELVAFLLTPNTLQACSLTGNTVNPFANRRVWTAGFAHQYNGVVAGDLFYGLTKSGLYRTIGKDAFAATDVFAQRVRPDLRGLQPGRSFVGSDTGKKQVVVFTSNARLGAGAGLQTRALVYNTEMDTWSTPCYLGNGTDDFVVKRHSWAPERILVVDSHYTVESFLNPVHQLGIPILGRMASNPVFFLPPLPYMGFGRPPVRGRKIKLNDARTLPEINAKEEWRLENGGRIEVSRWDDVRMRKWPGQRLVLYRVIEYRADGKPRYKRPLWLIFVPAAVDAEPPTPREAQAIYEEHFGVEHSIRFMKGDLGLTCGQFNSAEAEGRVQVWVEMVATAFWFLWVLRALAEMERERLPGWWSRGKLTLGTVLRLAAGLLLSLGWIKPQPEPRGKSLGRAAGTRFEPRKRFKSYRSASR